MKNTLTKSNYLIGLECPKMLWTTYNTPEKKPKLSKVDKFRLGEGIKVGQLAKKLYPNGLDITSLNEADYLKKSIDLLKEKKPLFEAGFVYNNCLARVDILAPVEGEWEIVEVKSGTKVKDVNLHDVSFQKYIYEANGIKIKGSYLLHLNKEYKKQGELELNELFVKEDISDKVDELLVDIEERISTIFDQIKEKKELLPGILLPKVIKAGNHNCLSENCLELPQDSVFYLYWGKKLARELFVKGIETIGDIPDDYVLTEKQNIQRDCEKNKKVHINKEAIQNFLAQIQYPIYYLDFETITTAIPMFDGLHPYAQVPFQFSLHTVKEEGVEPEHFEFLYDGCDDPRIEFIEALQNVLGDTGSIVVYNKSFEIKRLEELADFSPENRVWVTNSITRIVDLLEPFRGFYYYNPKQKGSASIKAVLPSITDTSYDDLDIAEGMIASVEYFRVTYNTCEPEEKQKVRDDLLKYCKLDTLAQYDIVEKLREITKQK